MTSGLFISNVSPTVGHHQLLSSLIPSSSSSRLFEINKPDVFEVCFPRLDLPIETELRCDCYYGYYELYQYSYCH